MIWGIALLFFFLYLTFGLLFIAVTTLFVAILLELQEAKRRRHSLWNANLVWDKSPGRAWRSWLSTPWGWCIKQVRRILLPSDILRFSCLLSGVSNRSGGLFYPLTLLRFNSKQSTKHVKKDYSTFRHFYGLARHAKYQTGQKALFWHFTVEPLHSALSDNHRHRLIIPLG